MGGEYADLYAVSKGNESLRIVSDTSLGFYDNPSKFLNDPAPTLNQIEKQAIAANGGATPATMTLVRHFDDYLLRRRKPKCGGASGPPAVVVHTNWYLTETYDFFWKSDKVTYGPWNGDQPWVQKNVQPFSPAEQKLLNNYHDWMYPDEAAK